MTQTATALYAFFSSFDIPAYAESSVPDEIDGEKVAAPYITYEIVVPDWRAQRVPLHARVWYRSDSIVQLAMMIDRIREALGEGVSIPTESGAVYLWADDNWAQVMPFEGDPTLKCAYLSFVMQAITN